MGGGLLQLVAYGAQDVYLTGNPQITFFRTIYRRHTNFATETIQCVFDGEVDFGRRVTCTIPRKGDLIGRMYVKIDIEKSVGGQIVSQYFPYGLGYRMIEYISIEIGGQEIDKHYGTWMYVWNELTVPIGKKNGLYTMTGVNTLYNYSIMSGVDGFGFKRAFGDTNSFSLYVPLQFWFCDNYSLALPLIALQYHEVKIVMKIPELGNWFCAFQGDGFTALDQAQHIKRKCISASLLVDMIYLDTDERRRFASTSHEYLIHQTQYNGANIISTTGKKSYNIPMNFNHPVKELIWMVREKNNPDLCLDSTDVYMINHSSASALEDNYNEIYNIIDTLKIMLNGHDRFKERKHDYFRIVQPYQHHQQSVSFGSFKNNSHRGLITLRKLDYYGVYSFALHPEEHQPSGTLNFSRIDTATMVVNTNDMSALSEDQEYELLLWARSYNVLRIMSGMGGLAFSS